MSVRYVGIGPRKGKSFITCGIIFKDGVADVSDELHASYGHVLRSEFGVVPASELPMSEDGKGRDADGDGKADVGKRGGLLPIGEREAQAEREKSEAEAADREKARLEQEQKEAAEAEERKRLEAEEDSKPGKRGKGRGR